MTRIEVERARPNQGIGLTALIGMLLSTGIVTSTLGGIFSKKIAIVLGAVVVGVLLVGIPELWAVLFFSSGIFKEWLTDTVQFFQSLDFTIFIASLALLAAVMYRFRKVNLPPLVISNGFVVLALLTAYMVFSLLYTPSFLYGGTKTVSFLTFNWIAFIIPIIIVTDIHKAKRTFIWLVLLALVVSCYTIFTISQGLIQRQLLTSVRASFLGVNPISYAGWLGAIAVIIFSIIPELKVRGFQLIALVCLCFIFFAMVAANSRGPFVSFASTIMLILGLRYWRTEKTKIVLGLLLIAVFVIIIFQVMPPEITSRYLDVTESQPVPKRMTLFTVNERLFFWRTAFLRTFDSIPRFLFGVGIGGFSHVAVRYDARLYPHNIFLEIFCELGFIGLILFLLFLGTTFAEIIKKIQSFQNVQARAFLFASTMAATFTLIGAQFSGDLNDNRRLWFLLGLSLAISRLAEMNSKPHLVGTNG